MPSDPSETGQMLCFIPGPTKVLLRQDAGVYWCFGCRKHLRHEDVLLGDEEPSYYDPVWVRKCTSCGQDRTAFPGREPL